LFAFLLLSLPAFAITTRSVAEGLTATQVVDLLSGEGATITNIKITGSNNAIGSFSAGGSLGIPSGVVLSTGTLADIAGPNNVENSGADLGTEGHPALDAIVDPFETQDAIVLEFDVVTVSPTFVIRYVFASEEYREWVDSEFNDVFAFFVDGGNIALTPGTSTPVTVNTINHNVNTGLYNDNEGGVDLEFDGYTTILQAIAVVEPNVTHRVRIAIADASDGVLDSAVFIAEGGISGTLIAPIIVPEVRGIEAQFGGNNTVRLPLFFAFESTPPTFTASGLPGATFNFTPIFVGPDGRTYTDLNIILGPDTPAGEHVVTVRSSVGGAESFATFIVVVDCNPPFILGTGQPLATEVDRGQRATISVSPSGSGPHSFQWYQGFRGMTGTPVAAGTNATLQTPPINDTTPFWVRITNPCGSVDSNTAFVSPR
jgi:hypothetical protein